MICYLELIQHLVQKDERKLFKKHYILINIKKKVSVTDLLFLFTWQLIFTLYTSNIVYKFHISIDALFIVGNN